MLFPYNVQNANMADYHRWTKDSTLSAADVYALIGSPPVFRLRYFAFNFLFPFMEVLMINGG